MSAPTRTLWTVYTVVVADVSADTPDEALEIHAQRLRRDGHEPHAHTEGVAMPAHDGFVLGDFEIIERFNHAGKVVDLDGNVVEVA